MIVSIILYPKSISNRKDKEIHHEPENRKEADS